MEMSPNTARSALLPWFLCLAAALTSDLQPMASAPSHGAPQPDNATLLFDSGSGLRNCSCSAAVQDCDEARANSWCRCHSVLRTALPRSGLGPPGSLTVWVREPWVLEELLNGSTVAHLRLSFCGAKPLQSRQLVLLGLRTLRVHSAAPGAPYPNQEVRVSAAELDDSSSLHMAFLDVGALNGRSALKAYSVIGPPLQAFSQFFPHLGFPLARTSSDAPDEPLESRRNSSEPLRKTFTTFVY
ncbi:exosomal polycystin-1-interacting protein-like [Fundulus diaphanus]